MLSLFRRNLPDQPAVVADMRQLSLRDCYAGLLAWDSFFHLSPRDQRAMFARFRAHAASKATLMFTSGPAEGEAIGEFNGEPLYHGSLSSDEYRSLLEGAGLRVIDHAVEDPTCGYRTVWLAQRCG
jgi:hypothetical protein